jgi:outer membrane protein
MPDASRCAFRLAIFPVVAAFLSLTLAAYAEEPVPLKRAVELALSHSTAVAASNSDAQRAFASYREVRNQFLPQLAVGSGLGQTWGYPLSLEGYAPAIINLNAQSTVLNPAVQDFVHAARAEWQGSLNQIKDQRAQVIQDTVLSYVELVKWQSSLEHLSKEYSSALKTEQLENERIQEGIDSPQARTQARLVTARIYLHMSQAQGSIDVLRSRLSHLTGLPVSSIQTDADSIPSLPEVSQADNLAAAAIENNPLVQVSENHSLSMDFRAHGEHRALWPSFDFATQYALLARFNNWQQFFPQKAFQQNNATIGVVIRFPFLSPSQHAHAQAADAAALHAQNEAEAARNQISEQTLKLQRAVEQLAAGQQVADLEYQVAKANLDAIRVKVEAGSATLREAADLQSAASERYNALQDANFELQRARITLLRATGDLESWVGVSH